MLRTNKEVPEAQSKRIYLALILVSAFAVFVRSPVSGSLWLDEALTTLFIQDSNAFSRVWSLQGQSPAYYVLLHYWTQLSGTSELALRLPSIFAALGVLAVMFGIGTRLTDHRGAAVAVVSMFLLNPFVVSALSARPYALALFASTGSMLALIRWVEEEDTSASVWYLLSVLCAFYFHYFFVGILIVHACYLFLVRNSVRIPKTKLIAVWLILSLLFVPGFEHLRSLAAKDSIYSFSSLPSVKSFLATILPPALFVAAITGAILARVYHRYRFHLGRVQNMPLFISCVIWALLPPALFFIASHLSGKPLFVARYMLWSAPGIVLAVSALIRSITSDSARRIVFLILVVLVILVPRQWMSEDWRGTLLSLEDYRTGSAPTLYYSGLVEADSLPLLRSEAYKDYFTAPLRYYKIPGDVLLLPSSFESEEMQRYWQEEVTPVLTNHSEILLLSPRMKQLADPERQSIVPDYFLSKIEELGFTHVDHLFGSRVQLYRLGKPTSVHGKSP